MGVEWGATLADAGLLGTGSAVLVGGLTVASIILIFVGLQRAIDARSGGVAQRLDRLNIGGAFMDASVVAGAARRPRWRSPIAYSRLDGAAPRGMSLRLARELAQADLKITVGEFLVLRGVLSSVGALLGFALPIAGHLLLAVILFLAGLYGPRIFVTRRKLARQNAFNSQLPDVITMMASALRSGYALLQAMELVAHEGPSPTGAEFDRVVREIGFGFSPEEALSNLQDRMQSEDLDLLVTALNVQREVGGNLVEVLDTIASTIRERVKLLGEVKVLTSQQQYSGYIIAMLPVGLALILTLINPTYELGVFQTTAWCGWVMLSCSLVMIFTGFMIIRKIVDIKV